MVTMEWWGTRIALSLVLIAMAIADWRQGRVPNSMTLPLLIIGGGLCLVRWWGGELNRGQMALVGVVGITCWLAWKWHLFGGGDMKLVMALTAFFPDGRFLGILLGTLTLVLGGLYLRRTGWQGLRQQAALVFLALQSQWPDRAEINGAYRSRGDRVTFAPVLAGLVYLWWN